MHHDLVDILVDRDVPPAEWERAVRRLKWFVARTDREWEILWLATPPTNGDVLWLQGRPIGNPWSIPTHLDVANDPIVPLLRAWLLTPPSTPPPPYPADGAPDPRPAEPPLVPLSADALTDDVCPGFACIQRTLSLGAAP